MTSCSATCAWCGATFEPAGTRGPRPSYCSNAHRQAAHRHRHTATPAEPDLDPVLEAALDRLALLTRTPGLIAGQRLRDAARQLLIAIGRTTVEQPPSPAPDASPEDAARPVDGALMLYQHRWNRARHRWEVTAHPIRNGQPAKRATLLARRQHPNHRPLTDAYSWSDPWGVPNTPAIQRLAAALIADAVGLPGGAHTRHRLLQPAAEHFAGDALWPLGGGNPWTLTNTQIINWLALHGHLTTVT